MAIYFTWELELINKARAFVAIKEKLDEAQDRLVKSGRYDAQDEMRYEVHCKKDELKEIIKGIELTEALKMIVSLLEKNEILAKTIYELTTPSIKE